MDERAPLSSRWLPRRTFEGRRAVVTGGGTGLGLEISRGLADLGAHVAILSRSPDHHRPLLEEAEQSGWRVTAHAVDVREPARVHDAAQEVLEAMIQQRSGAILNVVATYAWTGMPGVVHSASAKAGVLAMTRSLAAEWARHGIRVNAIAPGPFRSRGADSNLWPEEGERSRLEDSVPLGRFGHADEIAAHCLYLLSPACEWTTGECLVADGGLSLPSGMFERGRRARRAPRETSDGDS